MLIAPAPVIADRVTWRYSGRVKPALFDVSFQIEQGRTVLIQGGSGSGKSTLGLLLAGLLESPDDGELSGSIVVGKSPVGLVLQQPEDQTIFSRVADDVAFGLENTGVDPGAMNHIIQESLDALGLDLPHDWPTRKLSGGQRQRLALAGALAMKPGLLVLDEPTSALDAQGQAHVIEAVRSLASRGEMTIVIIDHNPELWSDIADEVFTLDNGSLLRSQRPAKKPARLPRRPAESEPSGKKIWEAQGLVASRDGLHHTTGPHDLSVHSGEILALMGPNGSGKTTLAMTMAGLLPALSGHITQPAWLEGVSSQRLSTFVGVVPQNPSHVFHRPTVRSELALSNSGPVVVEAAIMRWNLDSLLDAHPMSLSGGEQRRLAVAIATMNQQPLLVLDEPSQSLDEAAWQELVETLHGLAHTGVAIVMATHDDRLVHALGARVFELEAQSVAAGQTEARRSPSALDRANPLALVAAGLLPAVALLATLDSVSAATALGVFALVAPWLGIRAQGLWLRLVPVVLASVFAGITIALYGQASGEMFYSWGVLQVSEGSLELALATTLRILAIGGPAVLLLSLVDPTRFADALAQQARLPGDFVLGGLAALRLFEVVASDIQVRNWMARARGLGDKTPIVRVIHTTTAILVLAITRSQTLARAMQARGFGSGIARTHYRESVWTFSDSAWVVGGGMVGLIALLAAILSGNFNAVL
jgi:energy-coupling factor transport system ATP-binding protein